MINKENVYKYPNLFFYNLYLLDIYTLSTKLNSCNENKKLNNIYQI